MDWRVRGKKRSVKQVATYVFPVLPPSLPPSLPGLPHAYSGAVRWEEVEEAGSHLPLPLPSPLLVLLVSCPPLRILHHHPCRHPRRDGAAVAA